MDYKARYERWLNDDDIDQATKDELLSINDEKEIEDRFYKDLEFGTAGMRGIIAAGDNRINIYTVGKASEGVAQYIDKIGGHKKGIAIAYDSRHMSREFAVETANVMVAHGIRTYLYDDIRPVPMLSYAVRHLGCAVGIVITASHNPSKYNGYKVYGAHGGQIEPDDAKEIIANISAITDFGDIKTIGAVEMMESELYSVVPKEVDEAYYKKVDALVSKRDLIAQLGNNFKVVYTPIHGSGRYPVQTALENAGFTGLSVVEEQLEADGSFPTVKVPNPEEKETLSMAIELAKKVGADLCIGTDPDCDRMGVALKMGDGSFVSLTGNQIGCLMLDYILSSRKEAGTLPQNGAVIKTIVTTEMAKAIAKSYEIDIFSVLTGFKYIAGLISDFETSKSNEYLFGFEESFGYMAGSFVRDKDAVQACLIMSEMAAWYKSQDMTPYDGLQKLYEKHGYYIEETIAKSFPGIEGAEKMKGIIKTLRESAQKAIGSEKVIKFIDYGKEEGIDFATGEKFSSGLPKAEVLYFELENNGKFVVRPSGTEPKIKFYYGVCKNSESDARELLGQLKQFVENQLL